jgi:hypothetical protein
MPEKINGDKNFGSFFSHQRENNISGLPLLYNSCILGGVRWLMLT